MGHSSALSRYKQGVWLCLLSLLALSTRAQPHTYAAHSVLATGSWVKLGTARGGVYRIDKAFFTAHGLGSIDPRTLRIYGNAAGMLPQANATPRADDLTENPILAVGQDDGSLDDGDYFLFYADDPMQWRMSQTDGRYYHEKNLYTDSVFYFLTYGRGVGRRIQAVNTTGNPSRVVNTTDVLLAREDDHENLLGSGRQWFGDLYQAQNSYDYSFSLPNLAAGSLIYVRLRVAARAGSATTFTVGVGGSAVSSITLPPVNITSNETDFATQQTASFFLDPSQLTDGNLTLNLSYSGGGAGQGWLDYIEVEATQNLTLTTDRQYLRLLPGNALTQLQLAAPSGDIELWDVTEPSQPALQPLTGSSTAYSFVAQPDPSQPKTWLAFRRSAALTPAYLGPIPNQDLHALGQAQYLIVCPDGFLAQARRLAALHSDLTSAIVTPQQVYNEFAAGRQDVSAIRDFAKMFYDRAPSAAAKPKYLLLLGDGSYDYKGLQAAKSLIPTYQSRESLSPTITYTSDDFFGFLDANEGFWGEGTGQYEGDNSIQNHLLDIGVGRLPAATVAEAEAMVDKIVNYQSVGIAGRSWRSQVVLVADYKAEDGTLHAGQADSLGNIMRLAQPCLHQNKLYLDQYPAISSGSGLSFPDAHTALFNRLNQGALLVNYTGHGSENTLSNSVLVQNTDIQNLQNAGRLAFWVTATCEFGRYDNPRVRSGAELLLTQTGTGAIGLLSSVRLVFSSENFLFNSCWYTQALNYLPAEGRYITLGEALQAAKNATYGAAAINTRNFSLLADPALSLGLAPLQAVLTQINNKPLTDPDTLKALALVKLVGEVHDAQGALQAGYSGTVYVSVYDKAQRFTTLLAGFSYKAYRTLLFKGTATATGGKFQVSFVVPRAIDYSPGSGSIELYAEGSIADGMGCDQAAQICCTDPTALADTSAPHLQLYLNDTAWVAGGLTNPAPTLLARVSDALGINTSALGVGRALTAVIDGNAEAPVLLNDYYTATQDSHTAGQIVYPFSNLADGKHTLEVKVWNVNERSATAVTWFVVSSGARLALAQVLNYPNPFSETTRFSFQHNQPDVPLVLDVFIYNGFGQQVQHLTDSFTDAGFVHELAWDGKGAAGEPLPSGIYVYKLILRRADTGQTAAEARRMVILH